MGILSAKTQRTAKHAKLISSFDQVLHCKLSLSGFHFATHQPLHILRENIHFKINSSADLQFTQNRLPPCVRNDCYFEPGVAQRRYRQAYAVHRNRSLHRNVTAKLRRERKTHSISISFRCGRKQRPRSVHVTLNHVTAQSLAYGKRAFEVHSASRPQLTQCRAAQRLERRVRRERIAAHLDDG